MSITMCPLRDLVEPCRTWNPVNSTGSFTYIDLSSVDKDLKAITQVDQHSCSDAPSRARQLVGTGDVLVATVRPNLNGVALIEPIHDGMTASTGYCVLRPRRNVLDPRYLFYWVRTPHFVAAMVKVATGATYPAVSDAKVKDSLIPLLPLSEQRHIAAVLDATETLRLKRRSSIADLDSLVHSAFLDMFGDPLTNPKDWPVGIVGDLLASANYGTSKKPHDTDGAFPVLRMNNITYRGGWDFSSLKYVDLTPAEESRYLVHEGQLLFNRTNSKELVGKTAVYRRATPVAFAGYLVRAIVNEHADSEYVGAFMNTAHTKAYLRSRCKNIIGMANINAQEFQAIPVPKPPVDLQRRFAGIVGSIERQRDQLLAQLSELDKLFASLQSRAFSGELCSSTASRHHASA